MSKGNPRVILRMPAAELAELEKFIAASNERRRGEPWTMSDFIRAAVREKIAKMGRSAASGRKRGADAAP